MGLHFMTWLLYHVSRKSINWFKEVIGGRTHGHDGSQCKVEHEGVSLSILVTQATYLEAESVTSVETEIWITKPWKELNTKAMIQSQFLVFLYRILHLLSKNSIHKAEKDKIGYTGCSGSPF